MDIDVRLAARDCLQCVGEGVDADFRAGVDLCWPKSFSSDG